MKKILVLMLVTALAATILQAPAAGKKKAKPKPHTLYFHGTQQLGEVYYADDFAQTVTATPLGFQKMDASEPSAPAPRSMGVTNYVRGPNTTCSGNSLFPTWQGNIAGRVTGDFKVFLHSISPGTPVRVDLFVDSQGGCDSALGSTGYVPPVESWTGALAAGPGETEVVFKKVNFKALANIVVMVTPVDIDTGTPAGVVLDPSSQGRILYDSADYASRVEFKCAPTRGKTCALK